MTFTPDQEQTLLLAKARRRRSEAEGEVAPPTDQPPINTPPDTTKDQPVSFLDKLIKPRIDTQRPSKNIAPSPIADELKSFGSGFAEGGVYAVPLVGQAIGGVDLGRFAATGIHNLVSDNEWEQPDTLASQVTKSLGMDYAPKTSQGQVTKMAGMAVPSLGEKNLMNAAAKVPNFITGVREGAQFVKPEVVNNQTKAAAEIVRNLKAQHAAGGDSPETVIKMIKEARERDQPLGFGDVGGSENTRRAGVAYRQGGAKAREIIEQSVKNRDDPRLALKRWNALGNKYLGSGSIRQTLKDLTAARSVEGRPLFEASMRGTKPLGEQYAAAFTESAEKIKGHSEDVHALMKKINELKEELKANRGDVSTRIRLANDIKKAEGQLSIKQVELATAHSDQAAAIERMRGKTGEVQIPGATWSPQIQRLANNPIVKSGLNEGYAIERNLADAEGRVFNPKDYAVVVGKDGEMEIAEVPNMRTLAVAKEGLDARLAGDSGLRDEWGNLTKKGYSIKAVRDSLVRELDRLNPDYTKARNAWATKSEEMRALSFGEKALKTKAAYNAETLADMTEPEKEYARMALGETIRDTVMKYNLRGDEAKAILKSLDMQEKIRPFFRSDKDFNEYINAITVEKTMFEKGVEMVKGAQTADRLAGDNLAKLQQGVAVGQVAKDVATSHISDAIQKTIAAWQKMKGAQNPELNEAMAKLMFPDAEGIAQVEDALAKGAKK